MVQVAQQPKSAPQTLGAQTNPETPGNYQHGDIEPIYGAIGSDGQLDERIMKSLAALCRERTVVEQMLRQFVEDFAVLGASALPTWDVEARARAMRAIEKLKQVLATSGKYNWTSDSYPEMTADDAASVIEDGFYYRYYGDDFSICDVFEGLADVTGFHKAKYEYGLVDAKDAYEAYRIKELIIDFFLGVQGLEEDAEWGKENRKNQAVAAQPPTDPTDDPQYWMMKYSALLEKHMMYRQEQIDKYDAEVLARTETPADETTLHLHTSTD